MKFILLFLFLNPNHEPVGAQLFPGFFANYEVCQLMAEKVISDNEGKLPKGTVTGFKCMNVANVVAGEKATQL